jgi:hypothetical protein
VLLTLPLRVLTWRFQHEHLDIGTPADHASDSSRTDRAYPVR